MADTLGQVQSFEEAVGIAFSNGGAFIDFAGGEFFVFDEKTDASQIFIDSPFVPVVLAEALDEASAYDTAIANGGAFVEEFADGFQVSPGRLSFSALWVDANGNVFATSPDEVGPELVVQVPSTEEKSKLGIAKVIGVGVVALVGASLLGR